MLAIASGRRLFPFAFLLLISCSKTTKLHPVTGSAFLDGQPIEGATVVLQPLEAGLNNQTPSGIVGADGRFNLRTHPAGDGAQEGEYVVLITWYSADARLEANPKNKLPARYAIAHSSPWRVTIKPGNNDLEPFRLVR